MNDPHPNVEFCCTCLKIGVMGDKFVRLNFAPAEDITYKDKLESCVPEMGLENTEDWFLCKPCSAALETAYTFRCMCLRTESRLEEFRTSQTKSSKSNAKSMKQELIESATAEEETPTETYSRSLHECMERYPINVSVQCKYPIAVSVQSDSLPSQAEPPHSVTTSTTITSTQSEIIMSSDLPTTQCVEGESEIEIVKKELGSLLAGLEESVNINVQIFDKADSAKTRSDNNIPNPSEVAVEDVRNNFHKRDSIEEKKGFLLQGTPKPYSPMETKHDIENSDSLSKLDVRKKKLSDEELIDICCKTIPDLHNCTPESLDCQVTLERITVSNVPVKITKRKRTPIFGYKKNYKGKAFWCTICHKDIHRRDRFNAHILRHTNIRAYKCSSCREGFFSNADLNKHIKVCVAANQGASNISDNTNVLNDANIANKIINTSTADSTTPGNIIVSATTFTDVERNFVSATASKDHNISLVTPVKKKLEENLMETQSTSKDHGTKTKKSAPTPKDAATSSAKSRKSTRKSVVTRRVSNLNDVIYRCKECNYSSYYKQKYKVHLMHHANHKPFECSECSKRFYEKWELNRHNRNYHSDLVSENNSSTSTSKNLTRSSHSNFVSENNSSTSTSTSKDVTRSGRKITKRFHEAIADTRDDSDSWETAFYEPPISLVVNSGTVVTPIIQSIHSLAETPNAIEMSFACKLCDISFKSRNLLMLHTQTHELKRTCEVCREEFNSEEELLRHVPIHDVLEAAEEPVELELAPKLKNKKKKKKRKFFCNVCNREFSSRDHANVHTGARPYPCKVCGKQFAAYTTLRKHKLVHLSDGPGNNSQKKGDRKISSQRKTFSCEICNKKFVNKEYIYSHNCHSASGDTVYRCQICKNAFVGRAALIEHMGVHVSQNENTTE